MKQFLVCDNGYTEAEAWEPGCWVNVECPDEEDIIYLTRDLGIPRQVLDYTADVDERPRIERDGDWVLTILRIPVRTSGDPDTAPEPAYTVPIGIITSGDVVVTVCYHHTELITDFIAHSRTRAITVSGPSTFILRLIYSSAYWFLNYLKIINEGVGKAEKELSKSVRNSDLLQLMKLQRTLVYFNTSLRGNEVLISRLRHVFTDGFDLDLLEDVEIELKQALNTVNIYTEILAGTLDTYASVISNNVNMIMKRMTGTTIILMIPTLIASFYGMNVSIGLADVPGAFWIIVATAALLTLVTYLLLKHLKWF